MKTIVTTINNFEKDIEFNKELHLRRIYWFETVKSPLTGNTGTIKRSAFLDTVVKFKFKSDDKGQGLQYKKVELTINDTQFDKWVCVDIKVLDEPKAEKAQPALVDLIEG